MSRASNNERIRPPERRLYLAHAAAAGLSIMLGLASCALPAEPAGKVPPKAARKASPATTPAPLPTPVWPHPDAPLTPHAVRSANRGPVRIYLDAGHGAVQNSGNVGCRCQLEQDHTLAVAERCAARLGASRTFEVRMSREGEARPSYSNRVAEANRWEAHAFISLHSDWRDWPVEPRTTFTGPNGEECNRSTTGAGFVTIWNDEGELADSRAALGRSIASAMSQAGFLAYDGRSYGDSYDVDSTPGVFIDRRGLLVLRRPAMMSTIVETHHAMLEAEVARWDEVHTVDVFCDALGSGVLEALATSSP